MHFRQAFVCNTWMEYWRYVASFIGVDIRKRHALIPPLTLRFLLTLSGKHPVL